MNKRRHELGKNELADRLGTGIESAQSYIPWVLGGIAILAIGSIGWGFYSSSTNKKAAAAWGDYYFAMSGGDADGFLELAEKRQGTTASDWALQTAGSGYLEKGLGALYVDRKEGVDLIKLSIEQFEKIENTSDDDLKTKVLLGLAQAHESLGNVDEAVGFYEQLTKSTSQVRLLAKASERIAFLNSDDGKEFYTWFGKLDPTLDAAIELPKNLSSPPTGPDGMQFSDPALLDSGLGGDLDTENAFPQVDPAGLPPASTPPAELDLPAQDDAEKTDPSGLPSLEPAVEPEAPGTPEPAGDESK